MNKVLGHVVADSESATKDRQATGFAEFCKPRSKINKLNEYKKVRKITGLGNFSKPCSKVNKVSKNN